MPDSAFKEAPEPKPLRGSRADMAAGCTLGCLWQVVVFVGASWMLDQLLPERFTSLTSPAHYGLLLWGSAGLASLAAAWLVARPFFRRPGFDSWTLWSSWAIGTVLMTLFIWLMSMQ